MLGSGTDLLSNFVDRFSDDIEYMTGSRPNIFWKICWMFVTPVAMLAILVASIVLMSQGKASYYAWNMEKVSKLWVMGKLRLYYERALHINFD